MIFVMKFTAQSLHLLDIYRLCSDCLSLKFKSTYYVLTPVSCLRSLNIPMTIHIVTCLYLQQTIAEFSKIAISRSSFPSSVANKDIKNICYLLLSIKFFS